MPGEFFQSEILTSPFFFRTEEQKPSDQTHADLREISEEELNKVLDDHAKYFETDGFEGKMLNLTGFALLSANLEGAFLVQAI